AERAIAPRSSLIPPNSLVRRSDTVRVCKETSMRIYLSLLVIIPLSGVTNDAGISEVLGRAIKNHGGKETLNKLLSHRMKLNGIFLGADGSKVPFVSEFWFRYPDSFRDRLTINTEKRKLDVITVRNGGKGWRKTNGVVRELSKEELSITDVTFYIYWVSSLNPLLDRNDLSIAAVPAKMIEDPEAIGLKILGKERPDVTLYFDKDTGRLRSRELKARMVASGDLVRREDVFGHFKDFDGVPYPGTI